MIIWVIAGVVMLLFLAAVYGGFRQKAERDAQTLEMLRDKLPADVMREVRKNYEG